MDIPLGRSAPATEVAQGVAHRFAPAFGIPRNSQQVSVSSVQRDDQGLTHVRFDQQFQGYPVYGGTLAIHVDVNAAALVAVSNGLVPDLALPKGKRVAVSADQALDRARSALIGSTVIDPPRLMVFSPNAPYSDGSSSELAWMTRLADAHGASNVYAISASTGAILAVIDVSESAKYRRIWNTHNTTELPGDLALVEGGQATGNEDVNNSYWNAGNVWEYYKTTFNRDSYDNAGATLKATVHYGTSPNAFWNGDRVVYADGFPRLDVSGHEWTHAVTERTAGLEYQLQSGAANESFSDVFGELIERYVRGSADWLVGADAPGGPFRNMSNPAAEGQPGHLDNYISTCSDNGGVHLNSGILDRAFYLAKQAINPDKAGRVWYRALIHYLVPTSSFEDVRAAAIQAAEDLYGSAEVNGVRQAFNQVGLDGQAQPPTPSGCNFSGGPVCATATSLTGGTQGLDSDGPGANHVLATMYSVRDQLMQQSVAGAHYEEVYYDVTGRMSELLLGDPALRDHAAALLQDLTPPLDAVRAGDGGDVVLSPALATEMNNFLDDLAEEDKASGGGELAAVISRERGMVDLHSLVGLTFDQVLDRLATRVSAADEASD
ncbi:MAG: M4 family metallopeptidase [Actinomycetota bacterium]